MLYLVGVNHGFQIVGLYPHRMNPSAPLTYHKISEDFEQYQRPFFEWVKGFISQKKIVVLFEEWPLIADSKSSAASITKEMGIQYVQIDELPQNDNEDIREDIWIRKIEETFLTSKAGLAIVGDNHCQSLERKLKSKNFEVKVVRQSEIEEILIPKRYNDISLLNTL